VGSPDGEAGGDRSGHLHISWRRLVEANDD